MGCYFIWSAIWSWLHAASPVCLTRSAFCSFGLLPFGCEMFFGGIVGGKACSGLEKNKNSENNSEISENSEKMPQKVAMANLGAEKNPNT